VPSRNDLLAAAALGIALMGGVSAWLDRPGSVDVPDGRVDPGAFVVRPPASQEPIPAGDGEALLPVADFEVRGRVLNIERFRPYRSLSNWIPGLRPSTHDIGLGFGPMTDSANVRRFRYSHEGTTHGLRALYLRPRDAMTQQQWDALSPHVTNVHVIPASDAVYEKLRRIRHGELVTLHGQLVNVRLRDGQVATTSTTPGDRDCEIVYVTGIEVGRL
jgi:hypothetical protein